MMSRLNKLVKVVLQVVWVVLVKVLRLRQSLVRLHLAIPSIRGIHKVLEVVLLRGTPRSPEFENVQARSWDTHNPTCDDLLHALRWKLTQGSWMNDHDNYREFFSLSLPPAERLFQKRCNRFDLKDDHIHAGVNFFATSQEIVREWKLMGGGGYS
ncbi:hypothetical protein Hanom_Chr01g00010381 [Helianthus anomalus]